MKPDEIILEKLRKIYNVRNRGTEQEQAAIQAKLNQLCKKYGIEISDLEDENKTNHLFFFNPGEQLFLAQIISFILGDIPIVLHPEFNNAWQCSCSDAEFIEIKACFDFHWQKFQEEYELFFISYIQKNELFTKDAATPGIEKQIKQFNLYKLKTYMQGVQKNIYKSPENRGF